MFTSDLPFTTSNSVHNSTVSNAHSMWNQHPPECMPWSILSQPRVTRFSGESDVSPPCSNAMPMQLWDMHQQINKWKTAPCSNPMKRKLETSDDSFVRKQLITEDKIAAHLSQLHIGAGSTTPTPLRVDSVEDECVPCLDGVKIEAGSKLVLSEEIRRFQHENSIPSSILDSFTKPTMAVVLWQPRPDVHQLLQEVNKQEEESSSSESNIVERSSEADLDITEDDSNNNEPMNNFNLDDVNTRQSDLEMEDDL